MATRTADSTTDRPRPPRHAGRNKEIEDWLDAEGVTWTFHPDVPLDAFDEANSIRNQARSTPFIEGLVEQYATAMTDGIKFPPILAHAKRGKFVRLDGNHRAAALRQVGQQTVHVYEAHVSGEAATALALIANTRNGAQNTEQEKIEHGIWFLKSGASLKTAATKNQVSERVLRSAWVKWEASQRASMNNIPLKDWESLTPSVRGRLKNISTDEGFRAAAQLAFKARLGSEEVAELVTELNQSRSGRKQEAVVKSYTENVYAERIAESFSGALSTAGRGKGRTPRQSLGMIMTSLHSLPEDLTSLADSYVGDERRTTAERAREAAERLLAFADKLSADS